METSLGEGRERGRGEREGEREGERARLCTPTLKWYLAMDRQTGSDETLLLTLYDIKHLFPSVGLWRS